MKGKPAALALLAGAVLINTAVAADSVVSVNINGSSVDFSAYGNALPYIENDRVMIPIRAVAEGLGSNVDWNDKTETVTINGTIVLTINSSDALVNGSTVKLDAPARIKDSRTYVPLRFVSENLGADVDWDGNKRLVDIRTSGSAAENREVPQEYEQYTAAVYLGVKDRGTKNASQKDSFVHRFFQNGSVKEFTLQNDSTYSLQNKLAEGYIYDLKVKNGVVTEVYEAAPTAGTAAHTYKITAAAGNVSVTESSESKGLVYSEDSAYIIPASMPYSAPVKGTAGLKTLKNFIASSFEPVGHTLYVYGGGWNWQDNGSSVQAASIGIPQKWVDFFNTHNADYTYRTENAAATYYPHGEWNQYYFAGADCSGYVGWAVYNTLNTQSGGEGYVTASTKLAKSLSEKGLGTWTQTFSRTDFRPGDIMSMNGHVWIYLGGCADGSAVIMHSTPSDSVNGMPGGGVQLSALGGTDSEAYALVSKYMKTYYPDWSARYTPVAKNFSDYTAFSGDSAGKFSWSALEDPDGYANMTAAQILADLFDQTGE